MHRLRSLISRITGKPARPPRPHYLCTPGRTQAATSPCTRSTSRLVVDLAAHLPSLWQAVLAALKPGNTTDDLETAFVSATRARGLTSAFRGYRAYPRDITVSLNHEIINTLPSARRLRAADLVKIQFGLRDETSAFAYQAWTVPVATPEPTVEPLLAAGRAALTAAVGAACSGNRVGDVSFAIHERLATAGFWPSPHWVGHGIGTSLHMEPQVPGYAPKDIGVTPVLTPGTLLSLVVLAHATEPHVRVAKDGWNAFAVDKAPSVLFSHLVLVDADAPLLLTQDASPQAPTA